MTTVAVVPAKDRADSIEATVSALRALAAVDDVVVVDDGSRDATAERAAAAGAHVVRLPANRGKGAAVTAGVAAAPEADVYLLIDADLGGTAGLAAALLGPVLAGHADMTVAVLPSAGRRGGFGSIRRLAAAGIRRATGMEVRAPLSGQRAVAGPLLRSLPLADRFGLETGLTIDVVRAGARVVEVDVAMDHRHTGRRLAGFRHRGGQGIDVVRALWPRLTAARWRMALVAGVFVAASLASVWSGGRAEPASSAAPPTAGRVVLFGIPRLAWGDLGSGRLPALDALVAEGAVAATSIRTLSPLPSSTEGYATLGAGTRVAAPASAAEAFAAGTDLDGATAAEVLQQRTQRPVDGDVVVVGAPALQRTNDGRYLSSRPGALGDALHAAGRRTAVVNNADRRCSSTDRDEVSRPAAVAVMGSDGGVDAGQVECGLLQADANAPFGLRADPAAVLAAFDEALQSADVVIVDPGDIDRATRFAPLASPEAADALRQEALVATDALLARVVERLNDDDLLMVVSVAPPTSEWRLAPTVFTGAGVPHGYLHSPSTRRAGVITLTDVAPTVLAAMGLPPAEGMIGHALRYRPGPVDLDRLQALDRDAAFRERIYLPLTLAYIVFQSALYLVAALAFSRLGGLRRAGPPIRALVLAISAYPLATFVFRGIPNVAALGPAGGIAVLLAVDAAITALALRARPHALSPLSWILGATVALLALDVATGARLQTSSLLGYSLHTAARFTGLGNVAFAALAATTALFGAIHVTVAPRHREAVFTVACLFAFVVLVDGAPMLGSDVGGILTMVPIFGMALLAFSGRSLSRRTLAIAAAATVGMVALALGVDLLRPAASQTHLGRLVHDIATDGPGVLGTTLSRKLAVNLRSYRSPWSWAIVSIALYMLFVLVWSGGWRALLPRRSALRVGAVATLAVGLVGYAVNDSGAVVLALVFVYLGPYLTLLGLAREEGRPLLDGPFVPPFTGSSNVAANTTDGAERTRPVPVAGR